MFRETNNSFKVTVGNDTTFSRRYSIRVQFSSSSSVLKEFIGYLWRVAQCYRPLRFVLERGILALEIISRWVADTRAGCRTRKLFSDCRRTVRGGQEKMMTTKKRSLWGWTNHSVTANGGTSYTEMPKVFFRSRERTLRFFIHPIFTIILNYLLMYHA